jgi:3-isopropylmalate/(R)-2-methylmalate dehydratase small subunit
MRMNVIEGKVYVLGDNIDTDQIIPAQYLNLVPTIPEEYRELGRYALIGLPNADPPFVAEGAYQTEFPIIIGGENFGCGSSREHAPVALGAAGVKAVVAKSFARIFFRNSIATGELYPVESGAPLRTLFKTGETARLDLDANTIEHTGTGASHDLIALGDARHVIDAGGIFAYARKKGMIKS